MERIGDRRERSRTPPQPTEASRRSGMVSKTTLILRTLRYFWRSNVAVAAGVAVATAVLTGALMVGDSVTGSLAALVDERLGDTDDALAAPWFFPQSLVGRIAKDEAFGADFRSASAAVLVQGSCSAGSEAALRRAPAVQVIATDAAGLAVERGQCVPNGALAEDLGVKTGDAIQLRVVTVPDVPRDLPLGSRDADVRRLDLRVARVADEPGVANRFSLAPSQRVPRNCWVNLTQLAAEIDRPAQANTILVTAKPAARGAEFAGRLNQIMQSVASLADYGLTFRDAGEPGVAVLESKRIFLPPPLADAAREAGKRIGVTVTEVTVDLASTIERLDEHGNAAHGIPYAMVVGTDPPATRLARSPATGEDPSQATGPNSEASADDEIVLNEWTCGPDNLDAKVGDRVRLLCYRRRSDGQMEISDGGLVFRVAGILPDSGIGVDPTLTPVFHGVTDAATIDDWKPPGDLKIDMSRVRGEDRQYWDEHAAAPKAFISLAAAQRLWGSSLGGLTSLRIPADGKDAFVAELRRTLPPAAMGMAFRAVKAEQARGAGGSTDFGELFVYFSFFLIVSAAMLVALLYRLSIERRGGQIGLLAAVGFSPWQVLRMQAAVGMLVAVVGAAAGVPAAVGYAALMVYGLNTWWSGSVGAGFLTLHAVPATLAVGFASSLAVAAGAILWAVWRLRRARAVQLLSGGRSAVEALRGGRGLASRLTAILALAVGVVLVVLWAAGVPIDKVGAFFGGGVALLVAALAGLKVLLHAGGRRRMVAAGPMPMIGLGVRNAGRHAGRSVLTAGLIASAAFIIVTVAAMQKAAPTDTARRDSGAGGYTLIAEADLPLLFSPGTATGREQLAMDSRSNPVWGRVQVEPLRVSDGQDISCLNLYRPTRPRIAAVPDSMIARGGFTFAAAAGSKDNPWRLLQQPALIGGDPPQEKGSDTEKVSDTQADKAPFIPNRSVGVSDTFSVSDPGGPGVVPVIADAATAEWTLHMGLGDSLPITDEAGRTWRLKLVGLLAPSIFQGELLMGEANFRRLFPSVAGFRTLLISAPAADMAEVKRLLEQDSSLADFGVVVDATSQRLATYAAVEGTYMSTFQSLGSLGLLLGTVGLAVVLLRGLDERRRELALLASLGFRRGPLLRLVASENGFLLAAGLAGGAAAALVAAIPQMLSADSGANWPLVAATLAVLLLFGGAVLVAAAWAGLRVRPAADLHAE